MNKEMLMMIVSIMTEEMIIENLEEALMEHKLINTEETKGRLLFNCMCYNMKFAIDKEGVEKVIKDTQILSGLAATAGITKGDKPEPTEN